MNKDMHSYPVATRKILKECKAFIDGGHFIYQSGRHGDFYVNRDFLYAYPRKFDDVAFMLSEVIMGRWGTAFDVIMAPAQGGMILGHSLAYTLSVKSNRDITFVHTEVSKTMQASKVVLRRGFDKLIKGKRVLLCDSIVTTGNTLIGMAEVCQSYDAQVVGAAVICDRGQVRTLKFHPSESESLISSNTITLDILPLLELDLQTFEAKDCPFCKSGRPLDGKFTDSGVLQHIKDQDGIL